MLNKHRLTSRFLPAGQLTPGGLKGRGALGEPRRSKPRGTGGPSARSRGAAARGHHREQRDRGAWVERRDASFVIAGNRRFPACSQNASRSDDIAGLRPASGQNPPDSGNITRERRSLERQRAAGSEATESPRAVRAGRRPASRSRERRGLSASSRLSMISYLNTPNRHTQAPAAGTVAR